MLFGKRMTPIIRASQHSVGRLQHVVKQMILRDINHCKKFFAGHLQHYIHQ